MTEPILAELIEVKRSQHGPYLIPHIDGKEFPWYIDEGFTVALANKSSGMASVTVTIVTDKLVVLDDTNAGASNV